MKLAASLALTVGCADETPTSMQTSLYTSAGSADGTDSSDSADDEDESDDDDNDGSESGSDDDNDDDSNEEGGTDDPPAGDAIAFRFSSINIRDPHLYSNQGGIIGCVDITDSVPLMPGKSVNEQLNHAINVDEGPEMMPDGNLDLSLMLIFRNLEQADGGAGSVDFAVASCPVDGSPCDLLESSSLQSTSYTSNAAGPCDAQDPGHLGGYSPPPATTPGPCFSAGPVDVEIVTAQFTLPFGMAQLSATYQGDPATGLLSGSLSGFLSDATAASINLPPDLQQSAMATTIADLLGGSANGCGPASDNDGGGWYFYVDFTALPYEWGGA